MFHYDADNLALFAQSVPFIAGFGVNSKQKEEAGDAPLVDFDDPGLVEAMQMFASMSPDEMMETMGDLKKMLGDDPETLAAIEQVVAEIPKMKESDVKKSLKEMVEEDEIATATRDALKLLRSGAWDTIWDQRDQILEAVLASGKISPMDAARFRASPEEWEAELKHIWSELKKQAAAEDADEL